MEQRLFDWQKTHSGTPPKILGNKAFSISHCWKYLSNGIVRNSDLWYNSLIRIIHLLVLLDFRNLTAIRKFFQGFELSTCSVEDVINIIIVSTLLTILESHVANCTSWYFAVENYFLGNLTFFPLIFCVFWLILHSSLSYI